METATCTKCLIEKPLFEFGKNSRRKSGYNVRCKDCINQECRTRFQYYYNEEYKNKKKLYRDANPDIIKAQRKRANERRRTDEFRERRRIHRNLESEKARQKRWVERNREKRRMYERNRRALKRGSGKSIALKEWSALCGHYENLCACCRRMCRLTMDHIIPLSKGGTHYIENIQPLCVSCNSKKHNKNQINYLELLWLFEGKEVFVCRQ